MLRIVHTKSEGQLYFVQALAPSRRQARRSLSTIVTISQNNFIPLFRDSRLQHIVGKE